jgi:hypothetical protein
MARTQEGCPGATWFTLLAYSIVALAALLWEVDKVTDESSVNKWCVSAISISVAFSGLAVIASTFMKKKFVGTAMEGGLAFLLLCFWAAVMPYLMTPANGLAVSGGDGFAVVSAANLYFFSWFSLINSFILWFQYLRSAYGDDGGVDSNAVNKDFTPLLWGGVCAASFVAMLAAIRIKQGELVCDENDARCKRTKYAISLGVISAVLSAIWMTIGHKYAAKMDTGFSVLMLILWTFGVAYTTFGNSAPGAFLGNLYFSTWIAFVLVLSVTSSNLRRMFVKDDDDEAASDAAAAPGGEVGDEEKGQQQKEQEDTQTAEEIKA